ncbi:MAG: hypothetical protein ACLFOY_17935 [Desulfatibacillaceae bacterium]
MLVSKGAKGSGNKGLSGFRGWRERGPLACVPPGAVLSPELVRALNAEYERPGSWWTRVADDPQAFLIFRRGAVFVLLFGRLLLQVRWRNREVECLLHEDFLAWPKKGGRYAAVGGTGIVSGGMIAGMDGFAAEYNRIRQRAARLCGLERKVADSIAARLGCVVDREFVLPGGLGCKPCYVDLAAVDGSGTLVLHEVKLYANPETRGRTLPRMVEQIDHYEQQIMENGDRLVEKANRRLETARVLSGRFFATHIPQHPVRRIHPRVRLIVTGLDNAQKRHFEHRVRAGLEASFAWPRAASDILVFCEPKRIRADHLVEGLG